MELNADFSQRIAVHAARLPWVASPIPGVDRRMLDRIGDEVARATSVVRYAPGSRFSAHTHAGGEEFLVLDGIFQDEHGDYPAGSYVRNPPTSRHTPGSAPGCTLFVKLWQFDLEDRTSVRRDAQALVYARAQGRPGVEIASLFHDRREEVRVERWQPNASVVLDVPGGGEFLVLDGGFDECGEGFASQSWLRLPPSRRLCATRTGTAVPSGLRPGTSATFKSRPVRENGISWRTDPATFRQVVYREAHLSPASTQPQSTIISASCPSRSSWCGQTTVLVGRSLETQMSAVGLTLAGGRACHHGRDRAERGVCWRLWRNAVVSTIWKRASPRIIRA